MKFKAGVGIAVLLSLAIASTLIKSVKSSRFISPTDVHSKQAVAAQRSSQGKHRAGGVDQKILWEGFSKKFGENLKADFLPNGQLVSIRRPSGVNPSLNGAAAWEFRPDRTSDAMDRAREILNAASPLLRLRPDFPLKNGSAKVSSVSSHVFYDETYSGLPVRPVGNVKIDLGPRGELLGLYSDYACQLAIVNQQRISFEEAKSKVLEAFPDVHAISLERSPVKKVIWVTSQTEGRFAYDFTLRGHHIVVDAQTGQILHSQHEQQT